MNRYFTLVGLLSATYLFNKFQQGDFCLWSLLESILGFPIGIEGIHSISSKGNKNKSFTSKRIIVG